MITNYGKEKSNIVMSYVVCIRCEFGIDIFKNEDEANALNKKLEEYQDDAVGEEWNVDVESLVWEK